MKFLYSDETIIACSTSQHGNAAMAVIRISGFNSLTQFSAFFPLKLEAIEARRVYYTKLIYQGQRLDDICLTYFAGPKSYNGENILELSVHGNSLHIERVIDLFVDHGNCRPAQPGEFTYRALKNKKLSLSQVEGLDLFLNANSGYALDQGLSLLSGNLQEIYQELWHLYLMHKSSLELSIDFSEDIGDTAAKEYFLSSLKEFSAKFETLYKRTQAQSANLIQPEIVIAGLPNAGKSSLFNILLSDERAIVSAQAGTTRDYLTEHLEIAGVRYKLVDTAGLRVSQDQIEAEGIKRTRQKMDHSFFSILLINPLEMDPEFEQLSKHNFDLCYFTHADHPDFESKKDALIKKYPQFGSTGAISLKSVGANFEQNLFNAISHKYLKCIEHKPILLDRHKYLIGAAKLKLLSYTGLAQSETDVAILSADLNDMGHCISELVGIVSPDEVLNSIFTNFCIGK